MDSPFKTLRIVSTIYSLLGSIVLTIGILLMLMLVLALAFGRDVSTFSALGKIITLLNMALVSFGCIVSGTALLAHGEYLDLMFSVEDHLDEQTALMRKFLKSNLIKNEPD